MSVRGVQLAALGLLAAAMGAALVLAARSPDRALLVPEPGWPWIASPDPPSTGIVSAPFDALHQVDFVKRIDVDPGRAPLVVELQALRGFELSLDGRVLAARRWDEGSWRRPRRVTVREGLEAGSHELRVRVRNPTGPPLLRLRASGAGVALVADEGFTTRRDGGPPRAARRADDRLRAPGAVTVPPLWRSLSARRDAILGFAVLAGLASWSLRRERLPSGLREHPAWRRAPAALPWLAIAVLWAGLTWRAVGLPAWVGFDGPDHLDYVRGILEQHVIPLADAGAQTSHPPLFHALSAALLALLPSAPERVVLRILPVASGLVQVGVAAGLASALFPGDRLRLRATALAAGFLPLHLYMAAYLNNEPLHGALAAVALLGLTRWLLAPRPTARGAAGWGALVGLAILTKVSSLLLVPLAAGFVTARRALADRVGAVRTLAPGLALAAGAAGVSGAYFVRNQLHFGRAVIGNWDVPGSAVAWWQHPGFHTPAYYLRFGASLERPFFSAFESFWDGLYSTLWGDGLIGGMAGWAQRHALWDWDAMAALYALALPATALGLLGAAELVREALGGDDLRRRTALAFQTAVGFVLLFAALYMTLVLPAYSMAKASYLLPAAPIGALALGCGFARVHRATAAPSRRALQIGLHAWAGAFLGTVALAFLGGTG